MNTIIWSDLAYITFTDIADYLTEHYSLDAALRFNDEVDKLLDNLRSFKHLCPPHERRPSLRKCLVNRYSSLIYRVEGNEIYLITFLDNRSVLPF